MGVRPPIPNAANPIWRDYLPLIDALAFDPFPEPEQLNRLLPATATTSSGHPLRFRHAGELAAEGYEERIATTGVVSTRPENWHDLFNALVWARFPRIKAALNARHMDGIPRSGDGRRGALRDALTLFDESGALVLCSNRALLDTLSARNWRRAFWALREEWASCAVFVVGHALLEKALAPYRAMTAHALLLRVSRDFLGQPSAVLAEAVDRLLAARIGEGAWLNSPADLGPLPLAGIPGWWTEQNQDAAFYRDTSVFRPPRPGTEPTAVFKLA